MNYSAANICIFNARFKWTQIDIHSKCNLNTEYMSYRKKKMEGSGMEFENFVFAISLYSILIFHDKVDNINYMPLKNRAAKAPPACYSIWKWLRFWHTSNSGSV